jgi:hypothetical protein
MTVEELAREVGLYVATWAPGEGLPTYHDRQDFDDHRRYRFFTSPTEYFAGEGLFTALERREALVFLRGWQAHRDVAV